jgi:putative salt-induced outer membrane protein YdiY
MSHLRSPILGFLCVACLARSLLARNDENADLRLLPPVDDAAVSEETLPQPTPEADQSRPGDEGAEGDADRAAMLEDQFLWQDWFLPSHWRIPKGWDNSFEVGIDGSDGNSTTLSLRTGANLRRKEDSSDLKIAFNYVKASADYVQTKHNAQFEIQHDWLLGESRWSPYAKAIFVYDEFRPYTCELTLNAGIGYRFIKGETTTLTGRFGSGASRKFRGSNNVWEPEAMFGVDFEHRISDRQKLRATVEYYPEWDDFGLYRIRTDAGWEVLLDEKTNMNLKLGVIDRYDTRDSGQRPNALDYTLLLLWKL